MKTIIIFLLLICTNHLLAQQSNETLPIIKLPLIKNTNLSVIDNKLLFSTTKWKKIEEQYWVDYFGIENKKLWTGQQVADVRVLGYWGLGEAAIAYLYVVDILQDDNSIIPSVFISSYNASTKQKGIDINPFKQVPSPTGMKGKVVATSTISINTFGSCKATTTHKGSNKTFSKSVLFSINENGSISRL